MPQIKVWECPRTGKLFKTKGPYISHLKKLAGENFHENSRQKEMAKLKDFLEARRNEVTSIDNLNSYFIDNFDVMARLLDLRMGASKYRSLHKNEKTEGSSLLSFNISDLSKSMLVSNSHHAPIKNGIENWSRSDPSLPKGYPGYNGRVTYTIKGPENSRAWNEVFRMVGLNNGTGGGGGGSRATGRRYGFDVHIYLEDFPGLVGEFVTAYGNRLSLQDLASLKKLYDTTKLAAASYWTIDDVKNFEYVWPDVADAKYKELHWKILSEKQV